MIRQPFNNNAAITFTDEPFDRPPRYYTENKNYEYHEISVDKITIIFPPEIIVPERFENIKRLRSISTKIESGGHGKIFIHAEHMNPSVPLFITIQEAIYSIFEKGCLKLPLDKLQDPTALNDKEDIDNDFLRYMTFQGITRTAKLHEVELAFDIPEDQINFEALIGCHKMSKLFKGDTYYSPNVYTTNKAGKSRKKHKSIVAVYDRTKNLVDKGKLPESAMDGIHIIRIELRLPPNYIKNNMIPDRSIIGSKGESISPDFLRLKPGEVFVPMAGLCKRTLNNFIDNPEVWKDLDKSSHLYWMLFKADTRKIKKNWSNLDFDEFYRESL